MGIGMDLSARRADGSEFPVEISLAPTNSPDGQLVFATIVDLTTRKTLEAQLVQAQKMESVGRLAGGIAHDFNNMLFAIRSYADLLAEDLSPDAPRTRDGQAVAASIEGIIRAAEQAAALTGQLLAFSRRQVPRPVAVHVREAIVHIEPMLRRLIGDEVRLTFNLDPATGTTRLDPSQFDQVMVNLVVNARDAMPTGGTIAIETANILVDEPYALEHFDVTPGAYVVLTVSDTGVGMDRETRQHIFEPFFTTKESGKGTGLGLATIYGIVRQAGGHIWLYSEPGLGTTFKLYFPLDDAVDAGPPYRSEPARPRRGSVLLVEDEAAVREAARMVLERAGYAVRALGDPHEALGLVESQNVRFDVLVTDMVMPGMSGRELATRAMASRPSLGIVLLSGYSAETEEIEALGQEGRPIREQSSIAGRDLLALLEAAIEEHARAF